MLGRYGRLGNQMFQVAATMCLAKKRSVDLVLPDADIATIRRVFDIPCVELGQSHALTTQGRWQENAFCFQPDMHNLPPCVDVLGYLQSWRYILYEDLVRQVFTFKDSVRQESSRLLPKSELIALHVRRGDYLKFPNVFPLPTVSYYERCVESIQAERPESQPVLFTDDPEWCRRHFPSTLMFSTTEEQDLCMMSMCRHHVIANSSFSWWGAWLAKSDEQIVYAPQVWFGPEGPQDSQDLLPEHFRRAAC